MSPQPSTLTDRAYAAIKRRLIRLDIPPGAVFTESKMAAELGLGKTPVREALMRLQREGLVEVLARSGYRAAPVTLRDVKELMALRAILECEAASQAAQAMKDPHQLRSLDALCRVDYEPHDRASISRFLRANTEFHVTIAEASGNRRLARTLERLLHELERIFHLGLALTSRTQEIVHEHESLVDAIMRGDAASAREIALAQCQASQKMVLDALLSSPSLLSANIAIAPSQPAGRRSSAAPVTSSPRRKARRAGAKR
ncbi:MAG: GntR family transcriptional regulator [bacterium]|nr:GntR family transcriptional regulator [bacterium]